jgi:hypothetical protein
MNMSEGFVVKTQSINPPGALFLKLASIAEKRNKIRAALVREIARRTSDSHTISQFFHSW